MLPTGNIRCRDQSSGVCRDESPHGGVRPFHQKSTCVTQLTLGPYVVQIWSRHGRNFEPTKHAFSTERRVHPMQRQREPYSLEHRPHRDPRVKLPRHARCGGLVAFRFRLNSGKVDMSTFSLECARVWTRNSLECPTLRGVRSRRICREIRDLIAASIYDKYCRSVYSTNLYQMLFYNDRCAVIFIEPEYLS